MEPIVSIREINPDLIGKSDTVIYGGTFDPIHVGHLTAIRSLAALYPRVLIAPTGQNPWKDSIATPYAMRIQMITLVLTSEKIPFSEDPKDLGVVVFDSPYSYSVELLYELKKQVSGKIYWAVGEDGVDGIKNWKDWDRRGVPVVSVPIVIDIHSTTVRSGSERIHPALRDYVLLNKLYRNT